MKGWDSDKKLERWQREGLTLETAEEYLKFEIEVLQYRVSLGEILDKPSIYWNSVKQLEDRVLWLQDSIKIKKTRLYKILNES